MNNTTVNPKDLDSPHRELSDSGLGFVVAFLVCPGIDFFVCFDWGYNPAVH